MNPREQKKPDKFNWLAFFICTGSFLLGFGYGFLSNKHLQEEGGFAYGIGSGIWKGILFLLIGGIISWAISDSGSKKKE
jgi:hypothetical protein